SAETPHYPHSVELRVLAETGLLGAALAVLGLAAALLACARALARAPEPLARAVAAAALAGFGYWVLHGSFDWFWEFAGLGAPAFALLGLGCALAPRAGASRVAPPAPLAPDRPVPAGGRAPLRSRRLRRAPPTLAALVLAAAIVASLTAPWLSALQVQSAARIWVAAPAQAYARLRGAARLNPLADEADLVA